MKADVVYLDHMLDAIRTIGDYTKGGRDAFFADRLIQDAVIRNLEIIGEAAKQVSAETRALTPTVPWKRVAGMRDRLIHAYFGVSLPIVWQTLEQQLPTLRGAIEELLRRGEGADPAP